MVNGNSCDPHSIENMPVTALKGVGDAVAKKLARLNIFTVQDVLFHLPLRYQDRTRITPIASAPIGTEAIVEGTIRASDVVFGKRRSLVCRVQDNTGLLTLRLFYFSKAQQQQLKMGVTIQCFGEVRLGRGGIEMVHPEYRIKNNSPSTLLSATLTPVYPATEKVSQKTLRNLYFEAKKILQKNPITEWLPNKINDHHITLSDALLFLHEPPKNQSLQSLQQGSHSAQQRLVFEELLVHHLSLLQLRQKHQQDDAPELFLNDNFHNNYYAPFLQRLGFELTASQKKVLNEIQQDLCKKIPMLRLMQGDVGSGKTVVAILSALQALAQGYQVALIAPTEILARQHYYNFCQWLEPLKIKTAWLSGKQKASERREALEEIKNGDALFITGTHALFQEAVEYKNLAFVIIDEQHRFGVHQRLALKNKSALGITPHQLIMTATPIPRTLTMTAYADLDCSTISELPPGRTPVATTVIDDSRREDIIERIYQNCLQGRQAYWVCTLIEESETLQCQAAEKTAEDLSNRLENINVGLIHGRMKAKEKAAIMDEFNKGNIHLLVATTVIEVGVNVPNASLMVIENPERLGLAQLHQLRGRVGRGRIKSHCVLLYSAPLSRDGKERLTVMRETNDGFIIAEKDLAIRGPGEILGTKQTGLVDFRIADLNRDSHLLPKVKSAAELIIQKHPDIIEPLINRWIKKASEYAGV